LQISVNSATSATVSWNYSLNGTALTQGSTVTMPPALATCSTYLCFLVYGQVSYTYSPLFGYFTPAALNLSDTLYVTPRNSTCITFPTAGVNDCSASASSGSGSGNGNGGETAAPGAAMATAAMEAAMVAQAALLDRAAQAAEFRGGAAGGSRRATSAVTHW
jgi:hypothetical protein